MNGTYGIKCDDQHDNAAGNTHMTLIVIKNHPLKLLKMIDVGPAALTTEKRCEAEEAIMREGISIGPPVGWERCSNGNNDATGNDMVLALSKEHFLFKGAEVQNTHLRYYFQQRN